MCMLEILHSWFPALSRQCTIPGTFLHLTVTFDVSPDVPFCKREAVQTTLHVVDLTGLHAVTLYKKREQQGRKKKHHKPLLHRQLEPTSLVLVTACCHTDSSATKAHLMQTAYSTTPQSP